jgi:isoleucyl-tRNA synthetase
MKTNSQSLEYIEMKRTKTNLKKKHNKNLKNKRQKKRRKKPNIMDCYFDSCCNGSR